MLATIALVTTAKNTKVLIYPNFEINPIIVVTIIIVNTSNTVANIFLSISDSNKLNHPKKNFCPLPPQHPNNKNIGENIISNVILILKTAAKKPTITGAITPIIVNTINTNVSPNLDHKLFPIQSCHCGNGSLGICSGIVISVPCPSEPSSFVPPPLAPLTPLPNSIGYFSGSPCSFLSVSY